MELDYHCSAGRVGLDMHLLELQDENTMLEEYGLKELAVPFIKPTPPATKGMFVFDLKYFIECYNGLRVPWEIILSLPAPLGCRQGQDSEVGARLLLMLPLLTWHYYCQPPPHMWHVASPRRRY